jgi:hypothetical protein
MPNFAQNSFEHSHPARKTYGMLAALITSQEAVSMKTISSNVGLAIKTVVTLFIFTAVGSFATTYTVNSVADNGAGVSTSGDLRYCLAHAVDNDVLTFSLPNPRPSR